MDALVESRDVPTKGIEHILLDSSCHSPGTRQLYSHSVAPL